MRKSSRAKALKASLLIRRTRSSCARTFSRCWLLVARKRYCKLAKSRSPFHSDLHRKQLMQSVHFIARYDHPKVWKYANEMILAMLNSSDEGEIYAGMCALKSLVRTHISRIELTLPDLLMPCFRSSGSSTS